MAGDHECSRCGDTFPTERRRDRHMRKAHGVEPTSRKRKLAYAGVGVLAVVVVAGLLLAGGGDAPTSKGEALQKLGATDDPHMGNAAAPVAVVEFGSPRCTSCKAFHDRLLPSIRSKYLDTGEAALYYQQFIAGYRYDEPGGIAQECVHRHEGVDAFWTLTDVLYDQQGRWNEGNTASGLRDLAGQHGWDADAVATCYEDRATQSLYDGDIQSGRDNNVRGTPTFFVVGHDGETIRTSVSELDRTIQQEIDRAREA